MNNAAEQVDGAPEGLGRTTATVSGPTTAGVFGLANWTGLGAVVVAQALDIRLWRKRRAHTAATATARAG